SGKTLAYVLPIMQQLKHQEMFESYERRPKRPRVIILAPTRELAIQITAVMKSLSHSVKLSTQALVGGVDKGSQRKALENRPVDVVVATPGRLLQQWKDGNLFLGSVQTIIIDEMDTMLEQGFQRELREIMYPLLLHGTNGPSGNDKFDKQKQEQDRNQKLKFPPMKIISTPGLHKAVPRLEQVFVDVGNTDKISLLLDVIASQRAKATIVFCNTASAVRATQYALAEARIESLGYHGDLNSNTRSENLKKFRKIASDDSKKVDNFDNNNILVCTDLASRGLDIPQVDSVVMFDFPLNAMDYLHRSGRTARGVGKGRVTALVAKRDKVLATGIEQAVLRGETLDGISSRKSDYKPGARFSVKPKKTQNTTKKNDRRSLSDRKKDRPSSSNRKNA
ncbi:P-loop containing nucleoside triphosphate hydrolase protein, partial [Fragilariopsis cylindrus CCMP1102]